MCGESPGVMDECHGNFSFEFLCAIPLISASPQQNAEWLEWISNASNWHMNEDADLPTLCGNLTGARHCEPGYTCLCIGNNPNHGYTNFDNFMWSMLTTFQLITLDYWENVYNMVRLNRSESLSPITFSLC